MADEVQFKFEFVDKTGASPASSKPGASSSGGASSGVGESFQETAGDAPEKAQQRNERATGGAGKSRPASVPGSGASSPAAVAGSGSRGTPSEVISSLGDLASSARDFAKEAASGNVLGAIRAGRNVVDSVSGLGAGRTVVDSVSGLGAGRTVPSSEAASSGAPKTASDWGDKFTEARAAGAAMRSQTGTSFGTTGNAAGTAATTAARTVAGRAAFGVGASAVPSSGAAAGAGTVGLGGPLAALLLGAAIPPMVIAGSIRSGNQYADSVRDRVTQYSPEAAQAAAMAEVRQIMADIRTSERLGPAIARRIDEQSKISEDMQAIKDVFAKPFVEVGNELISILGSLVDVARQLTEVAAPAIEGVVEFYTFKPLLEFIARQLEKLRDDNDTPFDLLGWFEAQPHIHPPEWPTPAAGEAQVARDQIKFNKVPGLIL